MSILAGPQSPSVNELQDLGVARVSYGSGFLKADIGATKRLAQEILEKGTVAAMKEGMQTPEINSLVAKKLSCREPWSPNESFAGGLTILRLYLKFVTCAIFHGC